MPEKRVNLTAEDLIFWSHYGRILPLRPGTKIPIPRKGLTSATSDIALITEWYDRYPDANWAICPHPEALSVIDLDRKPNRPDGVALFLEHEGDLPTFHVRTPSHGVHLYFQGLGTRARTCNGRLPGIDLRGDHSGYVLLPGSALPNGVYESVGWLPAPLPTMPSWLLPMESVSEASGINSVYTLGESEGGFSMVGRHGLTILERDQLQLVSSVYLRLADTLAYKRGPGSRFPLADSSPSGCEFSLAYYVYRLGWTRDRFVAACCWWRSEHGLPQKPIGRYLKTWEKISTQNPPEIRLGNGGQRRLAPKGKWKRYQTGTQLMWALLVYGPKTPAELAVILGLDRGKVKLTLSRMARNLCVPCERPVVRTNGLYDLSDNGRAFIAYLDDASCQDSELDCPILQG